MLTAAITGLAPTADPCGTTTRHALGDRHYLLRLPATGACTNGHTLPLVMLIHCYGCEAHHEISKFSAAADMHSFALAAPEGIGRSFNAPSCCGHAREVGVDDVSFTDSLVSSITAEGAPRRFALNALFASGFSNGGFFASHLADASRMPWGAIAPVAGHEYSMSRSEPLPISMHHCATDKAVNASGCCALGNGEPTCCCGISFPTCISSQSIFQRWLQINKCRGARAASGPAGSTCTVGTGCTAETIFCLHAPGCVHGQWANYFPAAHQVFSFFARQACTRAGGEVLAEAEASHVAVAHQQPNARCRCGRGRYGPHCLATGGTDYVATHEHRGVGRAKQKR